MIEAALLRGVSVPALNKWTKVFPCAGAVVLLSHFYDFGKEAFKFIFGALSEQEESNSEGQASEDRELGVPVNEVKRWRRLARRRNKKAMLFMDDEECRFANMMWTHLAAPVMILHWSLFRNATWWSDRPDPSERSDGKDKMHQIAAFCEPSQNPALGIAEQLLKLLAEPQELKLLAFFYGGFSAWSQERKRALRMAALVTVGQLIRKLVEPFLEYPWRLWPLRCSDRPNQQKCAQDLLSAPKCCCDPGFAGRLQDLSLEELLDESRREFLDLIFSRVVLTSTFIERKFANFSRWSEQTKKGPSLRLLASKHFTRCFSEASATWRRRSGFKPGSKKGRPSWCGSMSKTPRLNGSHIFQRERRERLGAPQGALASTAFLKAGSEEWRALPQQEKKRYGRLAQAENARADVLRQAAAAARPAANTLGGPWNLSFIPETSGADWPLSPEQLRPALIRNGFQAEMRAWAEAWLLITYHCCLFIFFFFFFFFFLRGTA